MALIAVDPAFSLLKVNWIRREIPVDDGVAVVMEVEAFLADGWVLSELRAFQARRQADLEAGPGLGDQLRHQG